MRPNSSRRYHGHTPDEAAWVRAERERVSRYVAWFAIWFLLASFAAPYLGG